MSTVELSELVGYLGAVRVESVVSEENWALVTASAQGDPSPCPACGSGGRQPEHGDHRYKKSVGQEFHDQLIEVVWALQWHDV